LHRGPYAYSMVEQSQSLRMVTRALLTPRSLAIRSCKPIETPHAIGWMAKKEKGIFFSYASAQRLPLVGVCLDYKLFFTY